MNRGLIELISGDDLVLVISAQDENGGSVSLEGNTLALRVGDKNGKLMVTGTDTDNMDGTHTLSIEAVNTKSFTGQMTYEVAIINSATSETIIDLGDLNIIPGVN